MNLFSVTCLTCRRKLKVTDPQAIGTILACPNCGGMVQITPPEGWQNPAEPSPSSVAPVPPTPAKPPLRKTKPAAPSENVYEQVDAAVAGVGPAIPAAAALPIVPPATDALRIPAAATSLAQGASWLSYAGLAGGALVVAVVSALIVAAVGSSSQTEPTAQSPLSPSANTIAKASEANPATSTASTKEPNAPASSTPSSEKSKNDERESDIAVKASPKDVPPRNDEPAKYPANIEAGPSDAASRDKTVNAPSGKPSAPNPKIPAATQEPLGEDPKNDVDDELDIVDRSPGFALRPGIEPIDWPSRLDDKIPGVVCRQMPLADFIAMLSDVSNLRIALDVDSISEAGVRVTTPISVSLSGTTLGAALDAGLKPLKLKAVPNGRHLQVVRDGESLSTLRSIPYTVSDLAADRSAQLALAQQIANVIAPDSWKANGGNGSIEATDGGFIVEQTAANHFQVVLLCEKLRLARGLATKSKLDMSLLRLESRSHSIQAKLAQPVAAVFLSPTPLPKILAYVTKKTGIRFVIDHRSLDADGISPDVAGSFGAQNEPIAVALSAMLKKMQLTYRVVDENTLQITTAKGFRRECELYDVKGLLENGVTAEQIVDRIQSQVATGRWFQQGGKGAIDFDAASGTLIVSHSQLVQKEVAEFLSRWQSDAKVAKKTPAEK